MAESILNALLFKNNPKLPDWTPIDPQAQQAQAIKGNTAALGGLEKLAAGVNEITVNEFNKNMEKILPGYGGLRDKTTSNILDWESGKLSPEVQDLISRKAAEGARASGTSGSQFANFSEARTLGITSLDLQQRGTAAASSWIAQAAQRTPQFDITKMFINPMEQIGVATNERNAKFNYDYAKNIQAAQPEPWQRAVGGLLDWVATTAENVAGAYVSGGTNTTSGGKPGVQGQDSTQGMMSMFGGGGGGGMFGGGGDVNSQVNPQYTWPQ